MAAVTQERPHLGVTIFGSSNTSARYTLREKPGLFVLLVSYFLPPAHVQLRPLWMGLSSWLQRDHIGNITFLCRGI